MEITDALEAIFATEARVIVTSVSVRRSEGDLFTAVALAYSADDKPVIAFRSAATPQGAVARLAKCNTADYRPDKLRK